jgi:hypothetical protein
LPLPSYGIPGRKVSLRLAESPPIPGSRPFY